MPRINKAIALDMVGNAIDQAERLEMTLGDLNGSIELAKAEAAMAVLFNAPESELAKYTVTACVMQLVASMVFLADVTAKENAPENPVDQLIRESEKLYRDDRQN